MLKKYYIYNVMNICWQAEKQEARWVREPRLSFTQDVQQFFLHFVFVFFRRRLMRTVVDAFIFFSRTKIYVHHLTKSSCCISSLTIPFLTILNDFRLESRVSGRGIYHCDPFSCAVSPTTSCCYLRDQQHVCFFFFLEITIFHFP